MQTDHDTLRSPTPPQHLYTPLYPWQTRLIELLPGSPADPLICELLVADITNSETGLGVHRVADIVEYEALSYSWGRPERTATINCSGIIVAIPPSLATALQHLRKLDQIRPIWCDALCINQDDDKEKSHQVKQMLDIFKKASRIVAWLGPLDDHAARVLTAANLYSAKMYHCQCNVDLAISLTLLLQRGWFRRTWIRQEIFAGDDVNDICVQCGTWTTTFQRLWETYQTLETKLLDSKREEVYHQMVEDASTFRILRSDVDLSFDHRLSARTENWLKIVNDGAGFGVSDERDRVYGIIGMLSSTKQYSKHSSRGRMLDFPVDYSRSTSMVYTDLIRYLVYLSSNWDCLLVFTPASGRSPRLPSWAIDWSSSQPRVIVPLLVKPSQSDNRETREIVLRDPVTHKLHDAGEPLTMQGHVIGTCLERLDKQPSAEIHNDADTTSLTVFVNGIANLVQSNHYIPAISQGSGESACLSQVRVLIPSASLPTDILVHPLNTSLPLVLRQTKAPSTYQVIGPAVYATLNLPTTAPNPPYNKSWSTEIYEATTRLAASDVRLFVVPTLRQCALAPRPLERYKHRLPSWKKSAGSLSRTAPKHGSDVDWTASRDGKFVRRVTPEEVTGLLAGQGCGHCTQCQIGMEVGTFRLV